MSMKGIYISREQLQALTDWAARSRMEAEALLAEVKADNQAGNAPYLTRTGFKPVVCGGIMSERLKIASDERDR